MIGFFFELWGMIAVLPFIQAILEPEQIFANNFAKLFTKFFHITSSQGLMLLCREGL